MKTRQLGIFLFFVCFLGTSPAFPANAQDTDSPPPINEQLDPEAVAEHLAVSEERAPIRVLAVTTTHGFRHSSIETVKELLPAVAATTEFEFDITEDLTLLNDEHLAGYDLLLFANATLRIKAEAEKSEEDGGAVIYGFTFQTLEGVVEASFAFENLDSDTPFGSVLTAPGAPPIPLENFKYDPPMLEFSFNTFMTRHDLSRIHWTRLVDSERSAQNLQDLRGKILRIHKNGSIPKDNPFFGEPGVRWEIYAYGLRNPYRFKVDHETGALYIGVVGPDAGFDYDEYNISEKGGENFGWPRNMGRLFYNEITPEHIPNFVPPIWEYTYESGGRSATVGPIYRHEGESAFPDLLQNGLFVYDWSRRWIKWGHVDGSLYVAEFDGFWDPGPNSRLTRYRWIPNNTTSSSEK